MNMRGDWELAAVLIGAPVLAAQTPAVTWWHVVLFWLVAAAVVAGWYWRPHVSLPQRVPQVTTPVDLDQLLSRSVARERAAEWDEQTG